MRMVVAHIGREAYEPIRSDLHRLAVRSISISEVSCPDQDKAITLHYRGATLLHHLQPKIKLECIVPSKDVPAVIDTVLKHAGAHAQPYDTVFVVPIERTHRSAVNGSAETTTSELDAARISTGPAAAAAQDGVPADPARDTMSTPQAPAAVGLAKRSLLRRWIARPAGAAGNGAARSATGGIQ